MNELNDLGAIVIVGGNGRMGGFFRDLFRQASLPCQVIEPETSAIERERLLRAAGTVVVSVPISVTVSVIEQIVALLEESALLVDLTSVKERPVQAMMRHTGEVLGLHPMFAPGELGLKGQTVVVCQGRAHAKAGIFCRFLESSGAILKELTAVRHDQLMAIVQGLNHFHSIAFAHALGELGIPVEETIEVASPVYLLRMQLMGRILAQDPTLYADIQLHNPYVPAALNAFLSSSAEFMKAISSGSTEECIRFFTDAATSFGTYRDTALRESDRILEHVKSTE